MKVSTILLLVLLLAAAPLMAKPLRPKAEHAPTRTQQLAAVQYARYLTTALHLTHRQARAVRRLAAEQTQAAPAFLGRAQFEQGLLGVLSPGQYNAYTWLTESLPR